MDYAKEAKRHQEIAEWFRTMAEYTPENSLRTHYRGLAESYDRLAHDELRVARNLPRSN